MWCFFNKTKVLNAFLRGENAIIPYLILETHVIHRNNRWELLRIINVLFLTSPFVYIERRYSVGRRLLSWQNKAPYQIEEFYKSYKRDSHKQTKLSSDFSKQCRVLRIEKRLILSVHLYTPAINNLYSHSASFYPGI